MRKFLTNSVRSLLVVAVPTGLDRAHCSNNRHLDRNFVADAAEIAAPAVVNILCSVDSFAQIGTSSGSGFIISEDGYVVTNAHVVEQSTDGRVLVTMWNSKKLIGTVHSMDKQSDIAIVKLMDSHEQLPTAKIGNSGSLRVGEFVVALGSPLFLQNTVTFGIVSATARHGSELGMRRSRNDFIQTDAAVNVGNSGGPLVNLDGEVIGINAMKAQGTDGISFAIPMDTAAIIIKQLISQKRVIRPYIGLKMGEFAGSAGSGGAGSVRGRGRGRRGADSTSELISAKDAQIMIVEVEKGSPAEKAGLKSGDIIVEIDDKLVTSIRDILDAIGLDVGRTILFRVESQSGSSRIAKVTSEPEAR